MMKKKLGAALVILAMCSTASAGVLDGKYERRKVAVRICPDSEAEKGTFEGQAFLNIKDRTWNLVVDGKRTEATVVAAKVDQDFDIMLGFDDQSTALLSSTAGGDLSITVKQKDGCFIAGAWKRLSATDSY